MAAASLCALLLPAAAADAAQTFPDPGGSGASVTLDRTVVSPGEEIAITGSGFVGGTGSGDPLVTLRPYDIDRGPTWTAGGPDHYVEAGAHATEAAHWFRTHQPAGTFSARMRLPATARVDGPPPGGLNGKHWLRVLSGAFFTSTGDRVTTPISYIAPFEVVERAKLGLTVQPGAPPGQPTPPAVYREGTTFRASGPAPAIGPAAPARITVKGTRFTPNAPVTAELDGRPIATAPTSVSTDGEGTIPAGTTVTLPAVEQDAGKPGAHVLQVGTGDVVHAVPITITPQPTATIQTTAVRPGGTVAVAVRDYVNVEGNGQKVAIVVNEQVLGCVTADATGTGFGTATLPADLPVGGRNVLLNAGLSCVAPTAGGTLDDVPGSSRGQSIAVAADAPTATVPSGAQGTQVAVSGEGLVPGPASASYRGAPLTSNLAVAADGRLSGTVTLPEAVGEGPVVLTAGSSVAAAAVTISARPGPTAPTTDPGPSAQAPPATPAAPETPLAPVVPAPPISAPAPRPAAPAVVAGRLSSLKAQKGGRRLTVVLTGGSPVRTGVAIRTTAKVRLTRRGGARIVTLATRTLSRAGTHVLTLTADGRALLRRQRTVRVVVTLTPRGGAATRTTVTLKRA